MPIQVARIKSCSYHCKPRGQQYNHGSPKNVRTDPQSIMSITRAEYQLRVNGSNEVKADPTKAGTKFRIHVGLLAEPLVACYYCQSDRKAKESLSQRSVGHRN